MTELIEEQLGQTDYRIKQQARQFWRLLSQIQKVRRTLTGDDAKH